MRVARNQQTAPSLLRHRFRGLIRRRRQAFTPFLRFVELSANEGPEGNNSEEVLLKNNQTTFYLQ